MASPHTYGYPWHRTLVYRQESKLIEQSSKVSHWLLSSLSNLCQRVTPDQGRHVENFKKLAEDEETKQKAAQDASSDLLWLNNAIIACRALEYLSGCMDTEDIKEVWRNERYRPTELEILQGFYDYAWICLSRGSKNRKGNLCPNRKKRPPKSATKVEKREWYVSESRSALGMIQARWEAGETLKQIIRNWLE